MRAELPAWAAQRLAAPELPAAWTFGPRLTRQASGKPADWIIDAREYDEPDFSDFDVESMLRDVGADDE